MARTNKMGILKKKQQQAKQAKVKHQGHLQDGLKQSHTNPKGNTYQWFMRSGKRICDVTSAREDPDGYRAVRKPNGGEVDFVYKGADSWGRRRRIKKSRRVQRM